MMSVGGLDLARRSDHSVLTTMRQVGGIDTAGWQVIDVMQMPVGVPYRDQLDRLQPRLDKLDMLAVDAGGVGDGVTELVYGARLKRLVPIVIVGGTGRGKLINGRVSFGKGYLVSSLLDEMYHGLTVHPDADGRDILLRDFVEKQGGKHQMQEARTGSHDDAVLSLALAVYLARTLVRA